jgi:hypothetical protein
MAGSIPNKDTGILATLDAHVKGQAIDAIGGYFTSMTIGAGGVITPTLKSYIKGHSAPIMCSAFFTKLWIQDDTLLCVELLVDATTNNTVNAAAALSSMIGKDQQQIKFTGQVAAYQTNGETGGADVLKPAAIDGQIWRDTSGQLQLRGGGPCSTASHHLQVFYIGIMPKQSTDLQLNFGGQANGIWTVSPST